MLKSWAALPPRIRWPVGIAVTVVALAIVWALFVPLADWLAHHDVGSVRGSLHETALDNARGRLLTLGAGLFAAGALVFTARTFYLSQQTLNLSQRTFELTEQGQVTDRYTKAIDQLGSKELDVRIGGIYALERVARDSARDHPTVMEVLAAFIREHSHEKWTQSDPAGRGQERSTRPDVQAAITVVGRRNVMHDIPHQPIDLTGADLTRANLVRANLVGATLIRVTLRHATAAYANLAASFVTDAKLASANLIRANLVGTYLTRSDLSYAYLVEANLARADLRDADLTHTSLRRADMGEEPAIENLVLPDFSDAQLTGAKWSENMPVPDGWKLNASSGRLEPRGTNAGSADANQAGA